MSDSSTIHVVAATNDSYAEHLAVMLNSLLINKKSKNPIILYVIYSELSKDNQSLLNRVADKFQVRLKLKPIDPAVYNDFATFKYVTHETYYRISIPDLLNTTIDKAIYLDSDVVVTQDITKLWKIDLDSYLLGAVEDHALKTSRNKDLFMPEKAKYFNAGVLVINIKKWREARIKKKVIEFMKTHSTRIKYCDQDALNAILHDKWLPLDPKWNYQTKSIPSIAPTQINTAIIHYTGRDKPWQSDSVHPLKDAYLKYRKRYLAYLAKEG